MIGSSENRVSYNGDGVATEFAYQFKILEKSDMKVMRVDADGNTEILTKDYYVDVEKNVVIYPGYAPGAEIPESARPPILPEGWRLVLYREVPITQLSRLLDQWPFNIIEDALDKLTIICQQLKDSAMRSLHIDESHAADIDTTVPWQAGKSFRIGDDGKSVVLTEDPARVLPLAEAALQQAQAQAQAAAESAATATKNMELAGGYAEDAQSAMTTATKKAEQAADSATSASTSANHALGSMQNAQTYMQAAQKAMQQAGDFLEQAGAAAGSASASAKEAKETAATIRSIAEEVATVQKYLDAAQLAANEAATSESNAKGYANTATLAAQGANDSAEQAQQQAEEAQSFAAIAATQAQEANKGAVNAANSAMQAEKALDTLLANDDLISPDFATLNTAKCGDVVPPLYAVWDVAEIVVAARFGEMQAA